MNTTARLEILMRFPLNGFSFNPENKLGLEIASPDGAYSLVIKPKRPEEDGHGYRLGVEANLLCAVSCDPDQIDFISSFLSGTFKRRIGGAIPPLMSHGKLSVNEEGHIQDGVAFWFDWFPSDIKQMIDSTIDQAWKHFTRAIRLLRWGQNSPMQVPLRSDLALPYWRTSPDSLFHLIPQKASVRHSTGDVETGWFGWTGEKALAFNKLWENAELDEPLGQELQSEAEFLSERAPRSALLMATSAVEAGLKEHIIRIVPDAEWLLEEAPSPPIGKMLRRYIPMIHANNPYLELWERAKPLLKEFENSVVPERNKLAHLGKPAEPDNVREHIRRTRDILYLLDLMAGHEWALDQLSPSTRAILKLPASNDHRWINISVRSGPEIGD